MNNELKDFLTSLGYEISFDVGEPYTQPEEADVWVGHSRGSDRLRFASENTKTIALGIEGGINHPKDTSLLPGQIPDEFHYILNSIYKYAFLTSYTHSTNVLLMFYECFTLLYSKIASSNISPAVLTLLMTPSTSQLIIMSLSPT